MEMFDKNLLKDGDFILLQSRVSNLEMDIEKFKTHINSLRGMINRKMAVDVVAPVKEEFKSPDGLDDLR